MAALLCSKLNGGVRKMETAEYESVVIGFSGMWRVCRFSLEQRKCGIAKEITEAG